jgi:hypothetical protein
MGDQRGLSHDDIARDFNIRSIDSMSQTQSMNGSMRRASSFAEMSFNEKQNYFRY